MLIEIYPADDRFSVELLDDSIEIVYNGFVGGSVQEKSVQIRLPKLKKPKVTLTYTPGKTSTRHGVNVKEEGYTPCLSIEVSSIHVGRAVAREFAKAIYNTLINYYQREQLLKGISYLGELIYNDATPDFKKDPELKEALKAVLEYLKTTVGEQNDSPDFIIPV